MTNNSCWHVTKNGLLKIIGIRIIKLKVNVFWSSVPVTATTKEIIGYKNSKYILTKQTAAIIQNVFWPNLIYLGHKYEMGHRYYCSRVLDVTDHQDLIEQRGNQIFTGMFSLISSRMIKWKSCNKVAIYSPRVGSENCTKWNRLQQKNEC